MGAVKREDLPHPCLDIRLGDPAEPVALLQVIEPVARDDPGIGGEFLYLRRRGADQLAPHHLREERLVLAMAPLSERDQALRQLRLRRPLPGAPVETDVPPPD